MGSYATLYVGSRDFEWKGIIPDVAGLLFHCTDYHTAPLDTDGEDDSSDEHYFEHRFVSNCATAKTRLAQAGISLDLLRSLHFWAFAFDFSEFNGSLLYRCESYLEEKLGDRFSHERVRSMARHLLSRFRRMTHDEEFAHVLKLRRCEGTKQDYHDRMEAIIANPNRHRSEKPAEFDRLTFSRDYLREFISKDPYDNTGEDLYDDRTTGVFDLDLLYEVGMAIYASEDDVPLEMEFTEIVEARAPFSTQELQAFLDGMVQALRDRTQLMSAAFGCQETLLATDTVDVRADLVPHGRTAKERGDLFEVFIERLFEDEPGFTVHRQVRRSDQEIDLVVVNRVADPFWTSLQSPFLLVECRNRRRRVQAKDVRDFEVKLLNSSALARIGIIASTSGFTKACFTSGVRSCREGYRILLADRGAISDRLQHHLTTKDWIEKLLVEQM